MNVTDAERFSDLIRRRLAEIDEENQLGEAGQATVTLDQQSVGRLSRMDALQNQAMANAQRARRDQEAQMLRLALSRIGDGEYGYCEDCGEEIAKGRLELNLVAIRCVNCAMG